MKKLMAVALALALSGCAAEKAKLESFDASKLDLAVAASADFEAAAKYAESNGYADRAAVYRAINATRGAMEAQVNACVKAIADALPKEPAALQSVGPVLAFEMSAEAVGNFAGVPASVKIHCAPFPVILNPKMPLIPKL